MNKYLLKLIQPELTENQVRELCKEKKNELGFDIEKALFPTNPLLIDKPSISIGSAVELVEKCDSVWDSVRDSVWDSVRDSVRDSVCDLVWDSVCDSVWDSVRDSVCDLVWDSVRDSVCDLVAGSVWAYISSIFYNIEKWNGIEHEKGVNPFQPAIDLWEAGYISSFDGEVWRLHCGENAEVVWSGTFEKGE